MTDRVVGHHAHVVQPIEPIGHIWVACGLANLISSLPTIDSIWGPEAQERLVVSVEFGRPGEPPG